jgi:hypothetical protein
VVLDQVFTSCSEHRWTSIDDIIEIVEAIAGLTFVCTEVLGRLVLSRTGQPGSVPPA